MMVNQHNTTHRRSPLKFKSTFRSLKSTFIRNDGRILDGVIAGVGASANMIATEVCSSIVQKRLMSPANESAAAVRWANACDVPNIPMRVWVAGYVLDGMHLPTLLRRGAIDRAHVYLMADASFDMCDMQKRSYGDRIECMDPQRWRYAFRLVDGSFVSLTPAIELWLRPKHVRIHTVAADNSVLLGSRAIPVPHMLPSLFVVRDRQRRKQQRVVGAVYDQGARFSPRTALQFVKPRAQTNRATSHNHFARSQNNSSVFSDTSNSRQVSNTPSSFSSTITTDNNNNNNNMSQNTLNTADAFRMFDEIDIPTTLPSPAFIVPSTTSNPALPVLPSHRSITGQSESESESESDSDSSSSDDDDNGANKNVSTLQQATNVCPAPHTGGKRPPAEMFPEIAKTIAMAASDDSNHSVQDDDSDESASDAVNSASEGDDAKSLVNSTDNDDSDDDNSDDDTTNQSSDEENGVDGDNNKNKKKSKSKKSRNGKTPIQGKRKKESAEKTAAPRRSRAKKLSYKEIQQAMPKTWSRANRNTYIMGQISEKCYPIFDQFQSGKHEMRDWLNLNPKVNAKFQNFLSMHMAINNITPASAACSEPKFEDPLKALPRPSLLMDTKQYPQGIFDDNLPNNIGVMMRDYVMLGMVNAPHLLFAAPIAPTGKYVETADGLVPRGKLKRARNGGDADSDEQTSAKRAKTNASDVPPPPPPAEVTKPAPKPVAEPVKASNKHTEAEPKAKKTKKADDKSAKKEAKEKSDKKDKSKKKDKSEKKEKKEKKDKKEKSENKSSSKDKKKSSSSSKSS